MLLSNRFALIMTLSLVAPQVFAQSGLDLESLSALPAGVPETTLDNDDCIVPSDAQIKEDYVDTLRLDVNACGKAGYKQPVRPIKTLEVIRDYVNPGPGYLYGCRQVRRNYFTLAQVDTFVTELVQNADRAITSKSEKGISCVADSIRRWAQYGALTVTRPDSDPLGVSRAIRMESIAGLYLKYPEIRKFAKSKPSTINGNWHYDIKGWLQNIADQVMIESARDMNTVTGNNILYRKGNFMVQVGIIVGKASLLETGRKAFNLGISQITKKGYLPLELNRKTRAIGYHYSALMPLLSMFVLLKDQGCDVGRAEAQQKLKLLFGRVVQGARDPQSFAEPAGVASMPTGKSSKFKNSMSLLYGYSPAMYNEYTNYVKDTYGFSFAAYEKDNFHKIGVIEELGGLLLPLTKANANRAALSPIIGCPAK